MASFQIPPPEPFAFATPNDWPTWKKRFIRYRTASGLHEKPEGNQVDALVYLMGTQAEEVFNTFKLSDAEKKKFNVVLSKFDAYFIPRRNIIFERALFNTRIQQDGESVEDFVTALHALADTCNYGVLREELIRDRLVVGLRDRRVSEKLQLDADLDLLKALTVARQHETVRQQQAEMHNGQANKITIDNVRAGKNQPSSKNKPGKSAAGTSSPPPSAFAKAASGKMQTGSCGWCGRERHPKTQCPAKDATCRKCSKKGHFANACRGLPAIRTVQKEEPGFLGLASHGEPSKWDVPVVVNDTEVLFKVDTGADETVLPEVLFQSLFKEVKLKPARRPLDGPNGKPLIVVGMVQLKMTFKGRESFEDVYILRTLKSPLLGKPAIEKLDVLAELAAKVGAIEKGNIESEYPNLFRGLGTLKGEYDVKLKPDAKPFALTSPRRVPLPLYEKTKQELLRMQTEGVISPVAVPTSWCAPMVVVPKASGALRICVDFTELNKYILREWHPIPAVEHTLGMLQGAKLFSKIDANSGFWQIPISENSKLLTTFITPFGRFCFNRLPFGISSAPEHFQRRMAQILEGLDGVVCHMDDVLIWGSTRQQHDERLRDVMSRLSTAGVTLNMEKCQFSKTRISFLGHVLENNEVRPDREKLRAVAEMPNPTSKKELRRVMGMATYLARFVPNMAELLRPLSSMMSSKQDFVWESPQEDAFKRWKTLLSSDPVLGVYDPNKETVVTADASSYGLGAVLRQKQKNGQFKVIAYASRVLTDTERRYAQIEKEGLALVWACEKFRDFLVGSSFCLETDHKPLVSIFGSKALDDLTPRLQRMRMRLMRYTYDISYVPGKDLTAADALSRSPVRQAETTELAEEIQGFVEHVTSSLPVTHPSLKQIAAEQKVDLECQRVTKLCASGWPSRRDVGADLKEYWAHKDDIAMGKDILMCGSRIVIPRQFRESVLNQLHEGHFGIEKCRARARGSVWWPHIDTDIENLVKKCHTCLKHSRNKKMPLQPTEFPERPWQRVGMDLFFLNGQWWLIVVDYYSRYPELVRLSSLTGAAVVNHCKSLFARHGIPEVVVSDNGPQFSKTCHSEFAKFAQQYNFSHVTSSPHYPQSNGLAEAAVKIIKGSLDKSKDPYETLLAYRTSPLKNGYSPSELLMGRRLRTTLPVPAESLHPRTPDNQQLRVFESESRRKQKQDFDRHHGVRDLPLLDDDTDVWLVDLQRQGVVSGQADEPRSYWVQTNGESVRRNRTHLVALPKRSSPNVEGTQDCSASTEVHASCQDQTHTHTKSGRCVRPPQRFLV